MPVKLRTIWNRTAALLAALLLISWAALPAAAAGIDVSRRASLDVHFGAGTRDGFPGVEFRVYRVAEVSPSVKFTLTGAFADYPVQVNGLDSDGWRLLASTLESYVSRDDPRPTQTDRTDSRGWAEFSNLPAGLYLVVGEPYQEDGVIYTPEAFLICLPNRDKDGSWDYSPEAYCKYGQEDEEPDTVRRKVLKVWDDGGDRENRPRSIRVQLLRNGRVYDTVILSASNNWRYTWEELDGSYSWRVVEAGAPSGYTVTVEREGITFVITNTKTPDEPPDEPPDNPPDEPDEPDTDIPDEPPPSTDVPDEPPPDTDIPDEPPPSTDIPDEPDQPDEPGLPQTGMLWWPVPLLSCGGLLLFLLGWGRRRRDAQP